MIEQSDNEDGYDLFEAAGGNSGLKAAAATFGMTHTSIGPHRPDVHDDERLGLPGAAAIWWSPTVR